MFIVFVRHSSKASNPRGTWARTAVYSRVVYLEHRAAANSSQEIPSRFLISSSCLCPSSSSCLAECRTLSCRYKRRKFVSGERRRKNIFRSLFQVYLYVYLCHGIWPFSKPLDHKTNNESRLGYHQVSR